MPNTRAQEYKFTDMQNSWFRYKEAVEYLVDRNIIQGYEDGTFRPKNTINRAEFLKIVFKGHNTIKPSRRCFSDINPDEWYAPYICTAKNRNIINGYPDGTFQPAKTITFAEAIKIALGAYGREIEDGEGNSWFKPYVDELDSSGILAANSYIPWEPLSRERAAEIIWRLIRFDEERIMPNLSSGCGKAAIAAPTSVKVRNDERSFLVYVPNTNEIHKPLPLIIAFHGRTNSNEQVRKYYGLDKEFNNAVVVYPAAQSNGNGAFSWADPNNLSMPDTELFDSIVKTMSEAYCINMDEIYTVGHSLGGWMSNSIACVRGDVVKASVSVGGSSVITNCTGPSAAMIVHNPNDKLSPFSSSEQTRTLRTQKNSCSLETQSEVGNLNCRVHKDCWQGNDVLWCPHENNYDSQGNYYPHNWPEETAKQIKVFFESQ